jgi:hypothetical protein
MVASSVPWRKLCFPSIAVAFKTMLFQRERRFGWILLLTCRGKCHVIVEEATETWNAIEYVGARLEKLVKFSIPILQV